MNPRAHIEAYSKCQTLLNWVEDHEGMSYEDAKAIIQGVNDIFAKVERRKDGR